MQDGYYWATHKEFGSREIVLIESCDGHEDVMPLGADVCCSVDDFDAFVGPLKKPDQMPAEPASAGYYWAIDGGGHLMIVRVYADRPEKSPGTVNQWNYREVAIVGDSFARDISNFADFVGPIID